LPWVKAWHQKYSKRGLVVVGIHTPETEAEHKLENVRKHVAELGIPYAVAQDNTFASWRAYGVRAWPTTFLIDKQGRVRHAFQGELNWWSEKQRVPFDKLIEGVLAE
jgi:peroxiredoxin